MKATRFFLDTAYVLALLNPKDIYHKQARAVLPLMQSALKRSLDFYNNREDKEWGLTDCISFVVMTDQGLKEALTTDEHFQQAGFQVLLLD